MRNETYISSRRRVIRWDNSIAIADGYSSFSKPDPNTGEPVGQFSYAPLFITEEDGTWEGTWSANQIATNLSNAQLLKIAELQIADEYTIDQKMNWLMDGGDGTWGAPIRATYDSSRNWRLATDIQMITAVYAGQCVETLEKKSFTVTFNGKTELIPMSRIRAFDSDLWKLPDASQLVSVVSNTNAYGERPKGLVKLPIYFGNRIAWIFDRWLEKE